MELTVLALAGLLQVLPVALMAFPAHLELGPRKTLSPRDGEALAAQLSVPTARVTLGDASSPVTRAAAWLYLAARVADVPAYAFGPAPWRSAIWPVGLGATVAMLVAALL